MSDTPYERAAIAEATLTLVPPIIRESLLNLEGFSEEYGLQAEVMIGFESGRVHFRRSGLFDAIRTVFAGGGPVELTDAEERTWNLSVDEQVGELPRLLLLSDQQRLELPDFGILSHDTATRTRSLREFTLFVNLPHSAQEEWRTILEARALEDDEFDDFYCDVSDTPVHVEQTIRNELITGRSNISSLVPNSRRYFERLVGTYDGSSTIWDYADGTGGEVFRQLIEWQPYQGFLYSLLLSSHAGLIAELQVHGLVKEELERAFEYVKDQGDILSRLGALEVGLRILPDRPEVEPFLLSLLHRIRDDDVEGKTGEFQLFSSLFVLVDGELARMRLLVEEPPFYRRLASLAQAALIHRQVIQSGINYEQFSTWAFSNRIEHFYMQSLVDMRTEPRWNPDLVSAPQMQADFFRRIMIAGSDFQSNLDEGELHDTILGDKEYSLIRQCDVLRLYLSGPLEGAQESPNALPSDLGNLIAEQFKSDTVEVVSFVALTNSAMVFQIKSGHAELAAKALRRCNYTLANLESTSQLVGILNGLATVAAVSRSLSLADELRILVRRYRRDPQFGFSIDEALRVCLVASAVREELMEWRRFAGEWITELAFGELAENEGDALHSHLMVLLHSAPELWVSCARAEAALQAWRLR